MKQNALLSVGPHQNAGQPAENAPNDQPDDEIHRTSPVQVMRKKRSRQENVPEAGSYFETDLLADKQLERKSVVSGKSVSVHVDLGCSSNLKKKIRKQK